MGWNSERVERLKVMMNKNYSASQIAASLGEGITRNAVIGKMYRMKVAAEKEEVLNKKNSVNEVMDAANTHGSQRYDDTFHDKEQEIDAVPKEEVVSKDESHDVIMDIVLNDEHITANSNNTHKDCNEICNDTKDSTCQEETASEQKVKEYDVPLKDSKYEDSEKREIPSNNEDSTSETEEIAKLEKQALRISVLDLNERTCRWPLGDPTSDDFCFCGLPSIYGKSYCVGHQSIATYQLSSGRRDKKVVSM